MSQPIPATTPLADWRALHAGHFQSVRVLVTGGAGFIGSHLAQALTILGAQVIVIDDLSGGDRQNLAHLPGVSLMPSSILDADRLLRAIEGCKYVFHLAALGSVPASVLDPVRYHEVNTRGTLNVLEAARKSGSVQRVMFAASSAAYGDSPALPKVEHMPVLPRSPYAATKVACEGYLRAYATSYGLDTASLRYFNIFGPRQNANSAYAAVIAAFAKAIFAGQQPVIFGDGQQSRDFTFVENAVHANLLAARYTGLIEGEVFNVACGQRITVTQLATDMARLLDRPDLTPIYQPERVGDVKHSLADLSLIQKTLGYQPVVSLESGLSATLAWYKQVMTAG